MLHLNRARRCPSFHGGVEKARGRCTLSWARCGDSLRVSPGGGSPSKWSMLEGGVWQGRPHLGAGPSRSLLSRARCQKTSPEVQSVRGQSGCEAVGDKLCWWCSGGQETSPEHNHPRSCQRSVWLCGGNGRSSWGRRLRGEWPPTGSISRMACPCVKPGRGGKQPVFPAKAISPTKKLPRTGCKTRRVSE